jgi:hypothetical protein
MESTSKRSLREYTGKIRHLDAARARELVALFRRPIPATGLTAVCGSLDPIAAAAHGQASLARSPAGAGESIIGHYATHLARHREKLHLHGLTHLKEAAARALGRRTGHLCLSRLKSLSPTEAQPLSTHREPLYLNAIEITDAVVHFLGQHEGSLSLSPPSGISDHHLASLIRHVGPLSLGGLKKIDQRTAAILASQQGPRGIAGLFGLFINNVEHVTPPVAEILATHRAGELSLNGITLLTEETARELVRHPLLTLDGVASVTDRIARAGEEALSIG